MTRPVHIAPVHGGQTGVTVREFGPDGRAVIASSEAFATWDKAIAAVPRMQRELRDRVHLGPLTAPGAWPAEGREG